MSIIDISGKLEPVCYEMSTERLCSIYKIYLLTIIYEQAAQQLKIKFLDLQLYLCVQHIISSIK